MFWFDKEHPEALFCDNRKAEFVAMDRGKARKININPDMVCDYKNLPFDDESFRLVVFDPPHLVRAGDKSYMQMKYGKLPCDWRADLKAGFDECMRVLACDGVLIFKWSEVHIKTNELIRVVEQQPLIGHISGKAANTHWLTFMKIAETDGWSLEEES